MSTTTTTYRLPVESLDAFEKQVVKYNKRAEKKGWQQIEYTIGCDAKSEEQLVSGSWIDTFTNKVDTVDVHIKDIEMGDTSFIMVGVAKRVDGIDTVVGFDSEVSVSEYRGTCQCDHCNTKRDRATVYLFNQPDNKNIVQVGSTCVKDYFAMDSNELLARFKFMDTLFISMRGGESYGCTKVIPKYKVTDILSNAVCLMEKYGYVSVAGSKRNPDLFSTKDHVLSVYNNECSDEFKFISEVSEEQREVASKEVEAMIQWLNEQDDSNDFLVTVKSIVERGIATLSLVGYIVGLIGFYRNSLVVEDEDTETSSSEWIGTVGERMQFEGTIKSIKSFQGNYGTSYITIIVTLDGNVLKYWNKLNIRNSYDQPVVGDKVMFTAGVKDHSEYKGVKETILLRASKVSKA